MPTGIYIRNKTWPNLFQPEHKPWNYGIHSNNGGGTKKGSIPWNKGKKTGQKVWNKGTKGLYSWEYRKKIGESHKGEKCFFWKNGISSGNNRKEYVRLQANKRLSIKKGANGSFSIEEWDKVKRTNNLKCIICDRKEPEIKLTVDHIIPLTKGGTNYIDNIQPLCLSCNCRKGNRLDYLNKKEYTKDNGVSGKEPATS